MFHKDGLNTDPKMHGRLLGVGSPSQPPRSPAASGRPGSAPGAIHWIPLGVRAWLRPAGGTGTSCHVPVQALPIKDLVDRHRHGHDRLVLGRPLTKEGPGSFLVPPTVVHTAAEQDCVNGAARTRTPGLRSHNPARGGTRATAVESRGALPPMRAHPTATERCEYDHPDVPAEMRC